MGSECKNCGNELTSVCMQCHACMGCKDPTSQAARIAELEQIVKNFDAFMEALAALGQHAGKPDSHIEALLDKVKRVGELEATERELRDAVKVLATNLRAYIEDQSVGDWAADISDEVACNPIAAAAVREAGR